ncbi:sugar phosphate isomerase/epimerase family protein [Engelhardtia mirabilis]|uniref:Inosose dehydratase n=1 Tax=Engelhardtia mirabilis TaxID=2528011 RepID=A0A518BF92_9BACT|nr:Inosose dehydratase [Planctomycetes bacterium Pla133]QDU99976.1 Inosose dehydratase [Planctomycetes bacterium Pla86]
MRLACTPQPFYDRSLPEGLAAIAALGFEGLELPVHRGNPWVDLDALATGGAAVDELRAALERAGLELTCLSIHQDGQLLLGPHHGDTDRICAGSPDDKVAFARGRLEAAGRAAAALGLDLVIGFVGCEDYTRAFPWPDPGGWERMQPVFRERFAPVLDLYGELGLRFGQEPHPKQIVYNLETAHEALALFEGHQALAFNLDPANLLLAGIDPVVFAAELHGRVAHVHAKDGELVEHNARRSGLMAHGDWARPDRGFRFRVPGWGDVPWKRLISELTLRDYRGWLTVENEDPIFAPEDGLTKAREFLEPLLPKGERRGRWW